MGRGGGIEGGSSAKFAPVNSGRVSGRERYGVEMEMFPREQLGSVRRAAHANDEGPPRNLNEIDQWDADCAAAGLLGYIMGAAQCTGYTIVGCRGTAGSVSATKTEPRARELEVNG